MLDPLTGVRGIHAVRALANCHTFGIEVEPEWPERQPQTMVRNVLKLPFADGIFDAICMPPSSIAISKQSWKRAGSSTRLSQTAFQKSTQGRTTPLFLVKS